MTHRPAEGSDPSLAIRGQDGLAHSALNPCFPPPPSQPGGEAEARKRLDALTAGEPLENVYGSYRHPQATMIGDIRAALNGLDFDREHWARTRTAWTNFLAMYDCVDASDLEAKLVSSLARAEASEQKLARIRELADQRGERLAELVSSNASLEQHLSAALGEVERLTGEPAILTDQEFTDALAAIRTEALALLPPSGDVEGEGHV